MMYNRNDQQQKVIDYIASGCKAPGTEQVGLEIEHYLVRSSDLRTVNYFDQPGVETVLRDIRDLGYEASGEGDHVLQVDLPLGAITLEPGSQIEFSLERRSNIVDLVSNYDQTREIVERVLPDDFWMVNLGYHPVTKIDEIKILPKKRYDYMFNYFKKRGKMAHNMMKGTAAVQIALDYTSEADFVKKFQLLTRLTPVFYTMFDNAAHFEGEANPMRNTRMKIWENTDSDRSGIIPGSLSEDFGFGAYADYILDNPIIFRVVDGEAVSVGDQTFAELFDPEKDGEDFIYHAVSIVFPDVRVKRYIEYRVMDSVPISLAGACCAVLKGLLYHADNLNAYSERLAPMTEAELHRIREESESKGYDTPFMGGTILSFAQEMLQSVKKGLAPEEVALLGPLEDLVSRGLAPRDVFAAIEEKSGLEAAVRAFSAERIQDV